MCGIVGFIGPWDQPLLEQMTGLIAHRGPDDAGFHHARLRQRQANIGLGMRRLSIIDLDTGHQPIWNEDRTKAIIYNGELYNYRSLRPQLESNGHRFSTRTDTEVILHAYEEYGTEAVTRLEGMFAFAIWDQTQESLFIARDRMGIKPLYYQQTGEDTFVFGSEIKALLPVIGKREISKEALYHYLLYGFVMSGESILRGIFHLPPAHYLIWQDGKVATKRYWSLEKQAFPYWAEREWAEAIQAKLYEAVESHLVADVPVGITLSGGLDSSSVLAMMSRATEQARINSVTVGYHRPDDEMLYSRIAAGHFNIQVHETFTSLRAVSEAYRRIIYHLEEPLAHPVLGTTFFLAKAAREQLKVVLIGEGSDELFAGYPHYKLFTWPFVLAPRSLIRQYFFKIAYLMPSERIVASLLHPDWLDHSLLSHIAHLYDSYLDTRCMADGSLLCELEAELVGNQLLRIDKLMMAHSVEARVPFLDRTFVELAYSVPFRLKVKHGMEKYILRKAVEPLLPSEIVYRPKRGQKGTQALMPALVEELRLHYNHLLSTEAVKRRGIFRTQQLRERLERPLSPLGRFDPIRSRQKSKFYLAILSLEIWCQTFLDGVPYD